MVRAQTADQLVFGVKALALNAVFALITCFENDAFVPQSFKKRLNGTQMFRRRRPNKSVVRDLEHPSRRPAKISAQISSQ